MNKPVLFAYGFDGNGGGQNHSAEDAANKVNDQQLIWIDLDIHHPETAK